MSSDVSPGATLTFSQDDIGLPSKPPHQRLSKIGITPGIRNNYSLSQGENFRGFSVLVILLLR